MSFPETSLSLKQICQTFGVKNQDDSYSISNLRGGTLKYYNTIGEVTTIAGTGSFSVSSLRNKYLKNPSPLVLRVNTWVSYGSTASVNLSSWTPSTGTQIHYTWNIADKPPIKSFQVQLRGGDGGGGSGGFRWGVSQSGGDGGAGGSGASLISGNLAFTESLFANFIR